MRALTISLLLATISLLSGYGVAPAAVAQGHCLTSGEQRAEVRSGRVVRPGQVGRRADGKVLRLRLCRGPGGLEWRVQVLQRDGRVRPLVVDAHSGNPIR